MKEREGTNEYKWKGILEPKVTVEKEGKGFCNRNLERKATGGEGAENYFFTLIFILFFKVTPSPVVDTDWLVFDIWPVTRVGNGFFQRKKLCSKKVIC